MSRASSPASDVELVSEAAESITVYNKEEDIGMAEEVVEGTAGCSKTTYLKNGKISLRRSRLISTGLRIIQSKGSGMSY